MTDGAGSLGWAISAHQNDTHHSRSKNAILQLYDADRFGVKAISETMANQLGNND